MQRRQTWLPYLLILLALLILSLHEAGALGPLDTFLAYVAAPLERGFATFIDEVGSLFKTVRDVRQLQAEVEQLRRENDALRVENLRLQEQYVSENTQLRALLDFREANPTYTLIGADIVERGCELYPCARVIGEDTNPYLSYLIINVGSKDGVAVGMPVVSSGAVMVGRIARVTPHLAFVQLVNDPTSRVAAILQRSRVTGLVVGREDGSLVMTEILPDEKVEVGDVAVTSGLGGLLPKGLILGQVEEVSYSEAELFQEAVLRPQLDFRRLDVVVVITNFHPESPEELQELEGP